jgi:hypothetical protein
MANTDMCAGPSCRRVQAPCACNRVDCACGFCFSKGTWLPKLVPKGDGMRFLIHAADGRYDCWTQGADGSQRYWGSLYSRPEAKAWLEDGLRPVSVPVAPISAECSCGIARSRCDYHR